MLEIVMVVLALVLTAMGGLLLSTMHAAETGFRHEWRNGKATAGSSRPIED